MNKNSKRLALSILLLLMIAAAACTLRSLACIRHLESNLIYFSDRGLITAANVVLLVGIALLAAAVLRMDRDPLRATFDSPLTFVPTGIVATALVIFCITMLAMYNKLGSDSTYAGSSAIAMLALIVALLAPLSVIHFFLCAFLPQRHAKLRAYFAVATVLLGAAYAAFLYFMPGEPINSHNKLVEQMAYLFAALFFLYETRISLGREMWRAYVLFGMMAALLCAYAAIPALAVYFTNGRIITATVESAALLASFSIFIFARMCMTAAAAPDGECPEMAVLREYAERREKELSSDRIEDGEQISITELIDIPRSGSDAGEADDTAEDTEDKATDTESEAKEI